MSEVKHTRGPWKIENKRGKYRVRISGAGWEEFAKVIVRMQGDEQDLEEGLANANLIASAPELLEALDAFMQYVHDNQNEMEWPSQQRLVTLMDDAIDTIAKAKGLAA